MRKDVIAWVMAGAVIIATAACGDGGEPSVAQKAAAAAVRGVDRAQNERTLNRLEQARLALDRYAIDHGGEFPVAGSYQEAAAALVPLYTPRLDLEDSWGNALSYSSDGRSYTVTSAGDDGRPGTADDLILRDGAITGGS